MYCAQSRVMQAHEWEAALTHKAKRTEISVLKLCLKINEQNLNFKQEICWDSTC